MSKTAKHCRPKFTETKDFPTVLAEHKRALEKIAAADGDSALSAAVSKEERAAQTLARAPCKTDEAFFAKAAQLLASEGGNARFDQHYGALAIATAQYLKERVSPITFRSAYFDLEGEITDVERIADIALVTISDVLDEARPDKEQKTWSLTLSDNEINRLYFMSRHTLEMTEHLRRRYLARFDQARASDGNAEGTRT